MTIDLIQFRQVKKSLRSEINFAGLIFIQSILYSKTSLRYEVALGDFLTGNISNELARAFLVKSKLQTQIGQLLRRQLPEYRIRENIRPRWMESPHGERLELDFYLPQLRLAFEIQGEQHYRFVKHFHKNSEEFARAMRRDICKREICIEKDVELIEVASIDDFDMAQERISEAIERAGKSKLSDYLVKRVSQELINTISLKRNLAELDREIDRQIQSGAKKQLQKKKGKLLKSLETSAEIMRYICIVAIQEFHGLRKQRKGTGYDRWIAWRAAKKRKSADGTWIPLPRNRRWI